MIGVIAWGNMYSTTLKPLYVFLKRLRHVLILKTCFDVANIIVSYKTFEKTVTICFLLTRPFGFFMYYRKNIAPHDIFKI